MRDMKELVIISGKGGCGKTTIAASFACLARGAVIADCDVDAADLHLMMNPTIKREEDFYSGYEAWIDPEKCTRCGKCRELCRFDAIILSQNLAKVDPLACEGCGVCFDHCPAEAVVLKERHCGRIYHSDTCFGPFVHARLQIGAENSGKLVSTVRLRAKEMARKKKDPLVLIDGSPGIGCPVIASITGASLALVVTEPTPSGLSDMQRILQLTAHFHVPSLVCVAKADLYYPMVGRLRKEAEKMGAKMIGMIEYDTLATKAQIESRPLVSYPESIAGGAIRRIWHALQPFLNGSANDSSALPVL